MQKQQTLNDRPEHGVSYSVYLSVFGFLVISSQCSPGTKSSKRIIFNVSAPLNLAKDSLAFQTPRAKKKKKMHCEDRISLNSQGHGVQYICPILF